MSRHRHLLLMALALLAAVAVIAAATAQVLDPTWEVFRGPVIESL